MSSPASSHAALRDAFERELAAVLVDIARRPSRLVPDSPPSAPNFATQEVAVPISAPLKGKKKAPAPTGAEEIRRPDHHSRKAPTS